MHLVSGGRSSIGWDSPWWDEISQEAAVKDASLDSVPVGVTDLRTVVAAATSFTALTVLSLAMQTTHLGVLN